MKRGAIISGAGHASFIALAIFGVPETDDRILPPPSAVSEVTLISLDTYQAQFSDAPDQVETMSAAMAVPLPAPDETMPTPSAEPDQPQISQTQAPLAPSEEDAPDMSALALETPDIAPVPEPQLTQVEPDMPLGFDTPLLDAPVADGSVTSQSTAMLAPSTPNLAPRVDSSPAPAPPVEAEQAPEIREEVATAPEPTPEPAPEPPEDQTATAPEQSTTEITPEAQPQERSTAIRAATLPKGRPKTRPKPEEQEQPQTREERLIAAMRAANEAKEATDAKPQAPASTRLGQEFTAAQQDAIGNAIGNKWNKALIEGKDSFEQLVVTVRVRLRADGRVMGDIEAVEPRQPTGDFDVAYRAARRAILRSVPLPLPQEKFRDGDYLEIRFDPGRSAVSLN